MTLMDTISRKINAALERLFKSELARRSAQENEVEAEGKYDETRRYSGIENSSASGRTAGPRQPEKKAVAFRPRRPAS